VHLQVQCWGTLLFTAATENTSVYSYSAIKHTVNLHIHYSVVWIPADTISCKCKFSKKILIFLTYHDTLILQI